MNTKTTLLTVATAYITLIFPVGSSASEIANIISCNDNHHIECPQGSQILEGTYVFKDDELGCYKSCAINKINHGPEIIWKNNKIAIMGNYKNGKRHGIFTYYNPDGSINRKVQFKNGNIFKAK